MTCCIIATPRNPVLWSPYGTWLAPWPSPGGTVLTVCLRRARGFCGSPVQPDCGCVPLLEPSGVCLPWRPLESYQLGPLTSLVWVKHSHPTNREQSKPKTKGQVGLWLQILGSNFFFSTQKSGRDRWRGFSKPLPVPVISGPSLVEGRARPGFQLHRGVLTLNSPFLSVLFRT